MPAPNVVSHLRRFVEDGAGVYTAEVVLGPNDLLENVEVVPEVAWDAATSAALIAGDADDPDGFIESQNLKTLGVSVTLLETAAGAYVTSRELEIGKARGPRTVIFEVTSVGAGTAGRTLVRVTISEIPEAVIEAVKA